MKQRIAGVKGLIALVGVGLLALSGCLGNAPQHASQAAAPRLVMTWVAPYAVAASKARLNESFGGIGMKDGLSDLALQFWEPLPDGSAVARVQRGGDTSDAAVLELRDWGRAHGVRVLLCVYNYNVAKEAWDWPWARSAFATHPEQFVSSLVAELTRLDLDGIDLDLEGNGALDGDKQPYLQFVQQLSTRLHAQGKRLTLDSFAYVWHAPNQSWWKELFPLVDGINSMGYEEIGAGAGVGAEAWRSFAAQEAASGDDVGKLMLGMPANKDEWQGKAALQQLRWLRDRGRAGMSLWDSQLDGAAWRTREAWLTVSEIRKGAPR
ncbi:MAG TPA: glycosyl hydrolase family 18 protein [Polyangiaceae bacterium]|nr:glycosyl hydrolase family 18 protein [Polyangiaceae bacterium]